MERGEGGPKMRFWKYVMDRKWAIGVYLAMLVVVGLILLAEAEILQGAAGKG